MAVLLSTTILSSASAPNKLSFSHINGCRRGSNPSTATETIHRHFSGLSLDYKRHSNRKFSFVNLAAKNRTNVKTVKGNGRKIKPRDQVSSEGRDVKTVKRNGRKVKPRDQALSEGRDVKTVKRNGGKIKPRGPVLSEGRDEDEKYGPICPGCGVFMQDQNPDLPGYYQERKIAKEKLPQEEEDVSTFLDRDEEEEEEDDDDDDNMDMFLDGDEEEDDMDMFLDGDEEVGFEDVSEGEFEGSAEEEGELGKDDEVGFEDFSEGEFEGNDEEGELGKDDEVGFEDVSEGEFEGSDEEEGELGKDDEFDWDSDEWEDKILGKNEDIEYNGFAPAGVGYGNITEETVKQIKKEKVSKSEKKRRAREAMKVKDEVTVCARCHSLRNYGQVKNLTAENLIPDFDFDRLISTRLLKPGNANSTVVVMVVDCVDFDGSFPKRASQSLFEALEGAKDDPRRKRLPKLVLVATKVDLLPSQVSPTRLDRWVRHRARACGAPKLSGVYLVSSRKDLGVRNLLSFIKELAGPRGNVWIIGAQNAGKSTLINVFAKKGEAKVTRLTEAPVPGTTLGILRIGGILSAKAKMYDTPGLLHPYLMSMRLNRDEQKMVEIRKELQPRSYRILPGQAIHVGGLMRLDLKEASVTTIYVTVWASPSVSLHMGKIENADEFWRNNVGVRLQPPVSADRASELGKWEAREIEVSGDSWDVNSVDIAVAGFGWFSLGLKGTATLTLWVYEGIEVTMRDPLVLDRSHIILRRGFWLPKAVSDALREQSKLEDKRRKKLEEEEEDVDLLLEA